MVNRQIEFDNDHTDGIKNFKVEKPTLIRFHASWCGHCKSMKNDWDKLKEMFKNDNVDIIDVEEGVLGVFPANLKVIFSRILGKRQTICNYADSC